MNLYGNFSFNKSNINKKYKNKSTDKNIIQLKRNIDKEKYGVFILNGFNNNTNNKNNIETNENSSDISFYNTSLKNQILSPEEENDIYHYNNNNNRNKNFEILQKNSDDIDFNYLTLRNINNSNYINNNINNFKKENKKTLILDLDETLVHSSFQPLQFNNKIIKPDIYLKIFFNGKYHEIFVYKRPYLSKFLREMNKIFNLYIFTASIKKYAKPLLNHLDEHNFFIKKFYRESCILSGGKYIKDLSFLKIKLNDVIILDNNPISYKYNKKNGIPIKAWHYDKEDKELLKIIPLLDFLSKVDDIRKYVPFIIENDEINYNKISLLIHTSNRNINSCSHNKSIKQNIYNIRLNKKINYNIDEEMKVNHINNEATINFNEPSKNKIPKIPSKSNNSFNVYKNNMIKKAKKKKIRNKTKNNSNSVVNFNSDINNQLTVDIIDNIDNNYNLNNKLNDKYYHSCNNFYINNKYNFYINNNLRENQEKNIKYRKQILDLNNKEFNNEDEKTNNYINKYKHKKSKSKQIPCLRKNDNLICLNKKLTNTDRVENIIINKNDCKLKNYLNRFNSYKNIFPHKNFESCENEYYTLKPKIKLNNENINFRKNNTIEALSKNNSIRNIICYNNNCINTLNNNSSTKNTINYDKKLFKENKNKNCINTKNFPMKNNHSKTKENHSKKTSFILNNQENRVLMKKNIHKLLSLNLKNEDLVLSPNYYTNNHEITSRINKCHNLNDKNLFNNYSLKKEKINVDKNCFIKRKMKLKKSLLNNNKDNSKSRFNEEAYSNYKLLNYIPSSERNYKKSII